MLRVIRGASEQVNARSFSNLQWLDANQDLGGPIGRDPRGKHGGEREYA
jgi:hypothetical protein